MGVGVGVSVGVMEGVGVGVSSGDDQMLPSTLGVAVGVRVV